MISSLAAGGAERVLSLLANAWVARGHQVTIVTLTGVGGDAYELDRRVARLGLDLERESRSLLDGLVNNYRRVFALRRTIASVSAEVVISFIDKTNVLALIASAGLRIPVLVAERVHPAHHDIGRLWSLLRRLTYRRAAGLVVQSEAMRPWAEAVMPARRTYVIANPVAEPLRMVGRGEAARRPVVLGVGRLVCQKGFDLLIRAFDTVAEQHPEWSLVIVGKGPKDAELKGLAARCRRPSMVGFEGAVTDLEPYYRTAGLFVLPSRFEGFPNVLVEAMANGCAVIATNCPGATSEIVRDGIDGSLVRCEDVEALSEEMSRLMSDAPERGRLGLRAVEVVDRFRLDGVVGHWERVMSEVRS